jgi:hypothetical protein
MNKAWRKHTACLAVGLILGGNISRPRAQERPPMPDYDVAKTCQSDNAKDEEMCIRTEYVLRDSTSELWLKATPKVIAECIAVTGKFHSYTTLQKCLIGHRNDEKVR